MIACITADRLTSEFGDESDWSPAPGASPFAAKGAGRDDYDDDDAFEVEEGDDDDVFDDDEEEEDFFEDDEEEDDDPFLDDLEEEDDDL
jgi:hypothetical protein